MATGKLVTASGSNQPHRVPVTVAFALGVLVVSMVMLAFSVGRHFPMEPSTELEDTRALATGTTASGPLEEMIQRKAIAYDRLEVDRGGAENRTDSEVPTSTTRQAIRGDRDDD